MTVDEIMSINLSGLNAVLVGLPASGKSHIAARLYAKNPGHILISTDSYIGVDYEDSLYRLIEDLGNPDRPSFQPLLLEGVMVYRLLRKGLEVDCWKPDVIIDVQATRKQRHEIYMKERDPSKWKYVEKSDLGLLSIWNQYMASPQLKPPIFTLENNH